MSQTTTRTKQQSAAKAGKSERAILAHTGHQPVLMVRRYIREANLFTEHAAAGLL